MTSENPFKLLGHLKEPPLPRGEPNGEVDLLAHFGIKRLHEPVVTRPPTNYLRNAPGYPNKMKLFKGDQLSLTPLVLR